MLAELKGCAQAEVRALICGWRKYGMAPAKIRPHLLRKNGIKKLPKSLAALCKSLLHSLPESSGSRCPIDQAELEVGLEKPIRELNFEDGFDCLARRAQIGANFASISAGRIKRHIRQEHSDLSLNQRRLLPEKCKALAIFNRPHLRYFAVKDLKLKENASSDNGTAANLEKMSRDAIDSAQEKGSSGGAPGSADERCRNYFLSMAGWVAALGNISCEKAVECVKQLNLTRPVESKISKLCDDFLAEPGALASNHASYITLASIGLTAERKN